MHHFKSSFYNQYIYSLENKCEYWRWPQKFMYLSFLVIFEIVRSSVHIWYSEIWLYFFLVKCFRLLIRAYVFKSSCSCNGPFQSHFVNPVEISLLEVSASINSLCFSLSPCPNQCMLTKSQCLWQLVFDQCLWII